MPEKEELETTVGHPISNGLKQCILLEHKAEQTHCSARALGQVRQLKIRGFAKTRSCPQRPFFPSWSLSSNFQCFLGCNVKKSLSPTYFPCVTAVLPAPWPSGLFLISRSAAGSLLQPDHPCFQMSPRHKHASSQERRAATQPVKHLLAVLPAPPSLATPLQ